MAMTTKQHVGAYSGIAITIALITHFAPMLPKLIDSITQKNGIESVSKAQSEMSEVLSATKERVAALEEKTEGLDKTEWLLSLQTKGEEYGNRLTGVETQLIGVNEKLDDIKYDIRALSSGNRAGGVPLMQDVPLVGGVFKGKRKEMKSESWNK